MVSDRDRAHFELIGQLKAASRAAAQREHLERSISERLMLSWKVYEAYRGSARPSEAVDDPTAFYARARQLGLCLE